MIFGRRRIDPNTEEVLFRDGKQVPIKRHARQLLRVLALTKGRTVTKDQLMDAIWLDVTVSEDSPYQAVAEARHELGPDSSKVITTVAREGNRLSGLDFPAPSSQSHRAGAPLAALLLVCSVLLALRPSPTVETRHPVLAVLPFEAVSGQERMQRLGRGLVLTRGGIRDRPRHRCAPRREGAASADRAAQALAWVRVSLNLGSSMRLRCIEISSQSMASSVP